MASMSGADLLPAATLGGSSDPERQGLGEIIGGYEINFTSIAFWLRLGSCLYNTSPNMKPEACQPRYDFASLVRS